jgi:DNA-binding transcriptional ArsR family regulator
MTTVDDVFWIDSMEHLELLGDPIRLAIIENASRPRSVSEIADALGVPRTRLYHHVNLLEEAGMLRVAETREVGAMTERRYQVAAKSFQPSEKLLENALPQEKAEAMLTALFAATKADFIRAVEIGKITLEDPADHRRLTLGRRLARVTPERYDRFVTELDALIEDLDSDLDDPDAIDVGILHVVYPSSRTVEL